MSPATLEIVPEVAVLEHREDGEILVAGAGVKYYIFLAFFKRGDTPEELTQAIPALALATVHRLIAYYLDHQLEVDAWLAEIEREEAEVIRQWDERFPQNPELGSRLRARMAELRASHSG